MTLPLRHLRLLAALLFACDGGESAPRPEVELSLNTTVLTFQTRVGEVGAQAFELSNTGTTDLQFVVDPPVLEDPQACSASPWGPGSITGFLAPGRPELISITYAPLRRERCDALLHVRIADATTTGQEPTTLRLVGTAWGTDNDRDGFFSEEGTRLATDCDDEDPDVHPDALELCDGIDNNCDDLLDDADPALVEDPDASGRQPFHPDADRDGHPATEPVTWACALPDDHLPAPTDPLLWDCDDDNNLVHPLITDTVGQGDRNCDGLVACYLDLDGDGFGDGLTLHDGADPACNAVGVSLLDRDCDDGRADVNPFARERCDDLDVDEDCNGRADNTELGTVAVEGALAWFPDADGDGYGADGPTLSSCPGEQPAGRSVTRDDCDDGDPDIHPGSTLPELAADGDDQDCDGWELCYPDVDRDGQGSPTAAWVFGLSCAVLDGYSVSPADCNDLDPTVRTGAVEGTADGVDSNCDGLERCHRDLDADGHGHLTATDTVADLTCLASGVAATPTDCDDARNDINPDATEACNGLDDDCNGLRDEADGAGDRVLLDLDGDLFGDPTTLTLQCTPLPSYVPAPPSLVDLTAVDCDDARPLVYPGAAEVPGNGIDEDCDLSELCWQDLDRDRFGDAGLPLVAADLGCTRPGLASADGDCDDTTAVVNPGQAERCDAPGGPAVDEDCDGTVDDADPQGADGRTTWFRDLDADGHGDLDQTALRCVAPISYVAGDEDCDDDDALIHPDAFERCTNTADDDCDGLVNEAGDFGVDPVGQGAVQFFPDSDQDGYVADYDPKWACFAPAGHRTAPTNGAWDCADFDPSVHPGVVDQVGAGDRNCDDLVACRVDADGDGFGAGIIAHPATDPLCSTMGSQAGVPVPVTLTPGDCQDRRADVNPAAVEVCDPANVDENCNYLSDNAEIGQGAVVGLVHWYPDGDGDGFGRDGAADQLACPGDGPASASTVLGDCDDSDPTVHPSSAGAPVAEVAVDNIDQDCDGLERCYRDFDNDGVGDDAVVLLSPDISCTGLGTSWLPGDCDDNARLVHPGAPEQPANGVDQDCDARELCYQDIDRDGIGSETLVQSAALDCDVAGVSESSLDCDDARDDIGPGAVEDCDGDDNDCNGLVDEDDGVGDLYLRDGDLDLFGDPDTARLSCDPLPGFVLAPPVLTDPDRVDCDDSAPFVFPGATEVVANGVDEDCDLQEACWPDNDRDGYGRNAPMSVVFADLACTLRGSPRVGDCNDNNAGVHPGASERCEVAPASPVDNDCDGLADDADPEGAIGTATWYFDEDDDTYGAGSPVSACRAPTDHVSIAGDCNDRVSEIRPSAPELCNRLDDDCDSLIDDLDTLAFAHPQVAASTWYLDVDGDGYGSPVQFDTVRACTLPTGYASLSGDCKDDDPAIHPGAGETPADGVDGDCDGFELCYIDGDNDGVGGSLTRRETNRACTGVGVEPTTGDCDDTNALLSFERRLWFADLDGDGLGNPGIHELACSPPWPTGWVDNLLDCDDTSSDVGAGQVWYEDLDEDSYGDPARRIVACLRPLQSVLQAGDCDDDEPTANPGELEQCDNVDNNCDGTVDENTGFAFYRDDDGDSYGVSSDSLVTCDPADQPVGYVPRDGDCDDNEDRASPGQFELCDGVDNDCDGGIDLGTACYPPTVVHPDGRQFIFVDQFKRYVFADYFCSIRGYRLAWIPDAATETFLFAELDGLLAADPSLDPNDFRSMFIGLADQDCSASGGPTASRDWAWFDLDTGDCQPVDEVDPYVQARSTGLTPGQVPFLVRPGAAAGQWQSTNLNPQKAFICELRRP